MSATPAAGHTYSRPVYANQAAANGAVIDRFTEQLRRVRRALDYDVPKNISAIAHETGHSLSQVHEAVWSLIAIGLADHSNGLYRAKDVPNG